MHEARGNAGHPAAGRASVQPLWMPTVTDGHGHSVAPGPGRGREEPEGHAWGLMRVPAPA